MPLLNVVEAQQDLPAVMAVMALSDPDLLAFRSEYLIKFPISRMQHTLFSILVDSVPTAILLEDGQIREKWTGQMPESYMERICGFFEAVAPGATGRKVFGG